jgi:hypothetical protein
MNKERKSRKKELLKGTAGKWFVDHPTCRVTNKHNIILKFLLKLDEVCFMCIRILAEGVLLSRVLKTVSHHVC